MLLAYFFIVAFAFVFRKWIYVKKCPFTMAIVDWYNYLHCFNLLGQKLKTKAKYNPILNRTWKFAEKN